MMAGAIAISCLTALKPTAAAEPFIPRRQSKPPGPALSPADAIAAMTVPEGFTVELVASEPEIMNPVAMAFDERGRIWITESFEYPRLEPGPGRDRIKVLEDTTGDGRADKVTIFAEGLNIPSGIAVGHGGVWVANAPDILFLQDTDGDGKSDKQTVVVTGFGRDDTHELPNALTWGPDGYLYGLNGVFNHSHVKQGDKVFDFTCALFRIHPRTHQFELFAEGTSNPWGVTWDPEGNAFLSACVIDHLWHIAEDGYYHRQGGPYPPFTWKIESIVDYKHQAAAYCGITYFDSDAYPPEYRNRLYMGNIHGNCLNVDILHRHGSTYRGEKGPDFLTANDVWFMPVAQKVGPDGCLYVLDWYDRFHCYQDARAKPNEVDRGHGRLYRIRYEDSPRAAKFDLAKESGEQLIKRLGSPNIYFRQQAQLELASRGDRETLDHVLTVVRDRATPRNARLRALWTLVSHGPFNPAVHSDLLSHPDPGFRAWAVRAAGNFGDRTDDAVRGKLLTLVKDDAPEVQLQVAVACMKFTDVDPLPVLVDLLAYSGDDPLIPHIVWQNLHPLLGDRSAAFLTLVKKHDLNATPNLKKILPRATERILAARKP